MAANQVEAIKNDTMGFESFWTWLKGHANCVIRVCTPEAALFDDEEYHWAFHDDVEGAHLVQLLKGKKSVGEVAIFTQDVSYVQVSEAPEGGEAVVFELISEQKRDRIVTYSFLMAHGLDEEAATPPSKWRH